MAEAACSTRDPNDYWCLGSVVIAWAASVARRPTGIGNTWRTRVLSKIDTIFSDT